MMQGKGEKRETVLNRGALLSLSLSLSPAENDLSALDGYKDPQTVMMGRHWRKWPKKKKRKMLEGENRKTKGIYIKITKYTKKYIRKSTQYLKWFIFIKKYFLIYMINYKVFELS